LINRNYNRENYFHLAIYIKGDNWYGWYGIIGPQAKFDNKLPEMKKLRDLLKKEGMKSKWKHWLTWKDFVPNFNELSSLSSSESQEQFFEQWSETFWSFANEVRPVLESVNRTLQHSKT
jgi:hypothetical protein